MSTLLIGGDSRLAQPLKKLLKSYVSTSRRTGTLDKQTFFLDLSNTENFIPPDGVTNAVIIGGPTSYSESIQNQEIVEQIHRVKIPFIVKSLLTRNIFTIYISTNMVFGDESFERKETSQTNPSIQYGKIKRICEAECIDIAAQTNHGTRFSIVRLTKNISLNTSPFDRWASDYKKQNSISVFNDLYFCPITYEYSSQSIIQLLDKQIPGIFHISGEQNINYYDFMLLCNKYLMEHNAALFKIQETCSTDAGVNLEYKGNTSHLEMDRTEKLLGIKPFSLYDSVKYFCTRIK